MFSALILAPMAFGGGTLNCPCLSELPAGVAQYATENDNGLQNYLKSYPPVQQFPNCTTPKVYKQPLAFGLQCEYHDRGYAPSCNCEGPGASEAGCSGTYVNAGWCVERWCWVDCNNCNDPAMGKQSAYFPSNPSCYSYAACGNVDLYTDTNGCGNNDVTCS